MARTDAVVTVVFPATCALVGQVKPKVKSNLRNFRTHNGIDAQDHLLAVQKEVQN